jgi:5'-3' exonuclease
MSVKSKNNSAEKSSRRSAASTKRDTRKVILLDGHSLAFRAFFALPDTLVTSSGQVTNAVYGFTSSATRITKPDEPRRRICSGSSFL